MYSIFTGTQKHLISCQLNLSKHSSAIVALDIVVVYYIFFRISVLRNEMISHHEWKHLDRCHCFSICSPAFVNLEPHYGIHHAYIALNTKCCTLIMQNGSLHVSCIKFFWDLYFYPKHIIICSIEIVGFLKSL